LDCGQAFLKSADVGRVVREGVIGEADPAGKICGEEFSDCFCGKTKRYAFLHEGILRGYLSKLGDQAKDAAIYWKYGCWFSQDVWNILRDKTDMRSGDLISGFMKRIGLADHVIVILSDKYLRSPYCMTELHSIYQRSVGEKEDFLRRIIPLSLDDARFGNRRDRLVYAEHWKQEFQSLNEDLRDENRRLLLGREDFADFKAIQQWYPQVSDMLRYMNDVLSPHGFDEIVKDDFAALRQMLERHR
jgi:hypothetical protein